MTTTDPTTLLDFTDTHGDWDGPFEIVECRRALSPSGLPEMDYALNPYLGCEHGCMYCYGPGTTHTDPSSWRVVRVKQNIPARLAKELPGIEGIVGIGTVTDPYQYAERRFQLTRMCLEVLSARGFRIHLHTKSDLITRDLDILRGMEGVVGVTVTTVDDRVSRITEPGAPLPEARLRVLKELVDEGIDAYALVAPVMSTLEGSVDGLVEAISSTGVGVVYYNSLNMHNVSSVRMDRMGISRSSAAEAELVRIGRSRGLDVREVFSYRP